MSAPFHCQTESRLKFIDVAILEFYDRARQLGVDVVARRILRQYAVADASIAPADLKRLAKSMPLLTVEPDHVREACVDADALPEQRAGRSVSSASAKRIPIRDPQSDRLSFRLSPYEVVLLEYLRVNLKLPSRQRALETVIRFFALRDQALDKGAFERFAMKLLERSPRADRRDNKLQIDAFLSMKKSD